MADTLAEILAALEREEAVSLDVLADALAKRYPKGVVIAALESDAEAGTTTMHYNWRGGHYTTLGMVVRLEAIMLEAQAENGSDLAEEDDDT